MLYICITIKTPTIWVTHLNLSLYLFYVLSFLLALVLVPPKLMGIIIRPIIRSPSKWWRKLFGSIEVTICCIISVPINVNKKRGTIVPLLLLVLAHQLKPHPRLVHLMCPRGKNYSFHIVHTCMYNCMYYVLCDFRMPLKIWQGWLLVKCFSYYINTFGGLFFPIYLCVGALNFFKKYKAGWSILGPVVSVTIPQSYGEIF